MDSIVVMLATALAIVCVALSPFAFALLMKRPIRNRRIAAIPRTCANCAHFDLEEGQATMKRFPLFLKAAAWVPPSEMGRQVVGHERRPCRACTDGLVPVPGTTGETQACSRCDGTGQQEDEVFSAPSADVTSTWDQFGACRFDSVLVDGGDREETRRARRLQVLEEAGVAPDPNGDQDCFVLSDRARDAVA